ncbi:radical SAM protein [Caballeronia sp. LZ035]|uniref:radical SAM protein n=1 Tax=Caballeronia sp. LZ035 TaxID=3038568 RepID=UPI0028564455|nr:radical SAM protein [Caballeronia sp. LZ035]MDR5759691.1 radical SAM protein [Caballeronia sp. LZ035]
MNNRAPLLPPAQPSDLYRFPVDPTNSDADGEDVVAGFFRRQIEDLLSIVCLTKDGVPVDVDAFVFQKDRYSNDALAIRLFDPPRLRPDVRSTSDTNKNQARSTGGQERPQSFYDLDVLRRTEPRIEYLANALGALNTLVRVDVRDGKIVEFSLNDESHWIAPSQGDPNEVLGALTRACNARCEFCYVFGNPSNTTIKLNRRDNAGSTAEALRRLSYFSNGKMLPQPTYDLEEIMIHPAFREIATGIRKSTSTPMSITTNGYALTEDCVVFLKSLEPIEISLSLNAVSPDVRKRLMAGRHMKA